MAHEMPVPIHGTNDRRLPNGEKVDFGNNSKRNGPNHQRKASNNHGKKNKLTTAEPSLPNGSKPDFGSDKKQKDYGYDSSSDSSHHSSARDNKDGRDKKKNGKKQGKKEDVFAGTTFHSSPEALNLPKPSFKSSSPKAEPQHPVTNYPSPYHMPNSTGPVPQPAMGPNGSMYPIANGMVGGGLPVGLPMQGTLYPGQMVPGAPGANYYPYYNQQYQHPLQQYPPQQHPPQHQLPPQDTKQPPAYPVQPFPATSAATQGQKISFNDLLGSSK